MARALLEVLFRSIWTFLSLFGALLYFILVSSWFFVFFSGLCFEACFSCFLESPGRQSGRFQWSRCTTTTTSVREGRRNRENEFFLFFGSWDLSFDAFGLLLGPLWASFWRLWGSPVPSGVSVGVQRVFKNPKID